MQLISFGRFILLGDLSLWRLQSHAHVAQATPSEPPCFVLSLLSVSNKKKQAIQTKRQLLCKVTHMNLFFFNALLYDVSEKEVKNRKNCSKFVHEGHKFSLACCWVF